jgi:mono/diheme cytochrome c family protein
VKHTLGIFLFTILVTAFYGYVGQLVPQKETYPPQDTEVGESLTTSEMVDVGREIYEGKGTCVGCHTIGSSEAGRFPDLAGIGASSAAKIEGLNDVEYLAESLYEPDKYIVNGFSPGMPPVNKPPISLNRQEALTVIAYLQSLGGQPTVTMQTKLAYAAESQESAAANVAPGEELGAEALLTAQGCSACHHLTEPVRLVGPSLFDVGKRLTRGEIYEALMDPDATIAEGYPPGLMGASMTVSGFYEKITLRQLESMVNYLALLDGDQ